MFQTFGRHSGCWDRVSLVRKQSYFMFVHSAIKIPFLCNANIFCLLHLNILSFFLPKGEFPYMKWLASIGASTAFIIFITKLLQVHRLVVSKCVV